MIVDLFVLSILNCGVCVFVFDSVKEPKHPVLFTAYVFILNFKPFATLIVFYILLITLVLELNYMSDIGRVLGIFNVFLVPVTIYVWKRGPTTTHKLFGKYSCAVFLDVAPDEMRKGGPMIRPLIFFWDIYKKYFLSIFVYLVI